MADKILNTRIRLKVDSYAAWSTSSIILGNGEYAAVRVSASDTTAPVPAGVYIKIGDGTSGFNALPFISATDPTISAWAKASTKPTYEASEISGLEDFIAGEIKDTNTKYQIVKVDDYNFKLQSKDLDATDWTDAFTITIPNDTDAIKALETLVGNKSVATQISDAIDDLKEAIVNSITAADKSITIGGIATAPTVGVKISETAGNALKLAEDGLSVSVPAATDYTVTVTETDSTVYAKVYNIKQTATGLNATINIPKDMVVSSGAVVTDPEGQDPGTYIELTLANATNDKLYINVGDLIEYVTSGSTTDDQIQITVSADHKVTATLKDGSITKDQLAEAVQTSLNKAESALKADDITSGSANGTIAVKGTDVKIKGIGTAAYQSVDDFATPTNLSTLKGELEGQDSDTKDSNTIAGAKKYADNLISGLKVDIPDVLTTEQVVQSVGQKDGQIVVAYTTLNKIAFDGKTDNLVQGDNTLIFNCGGASE